MPVPKRTEARRSLVGAGYMPKGGAAAASRHNEAVRARTAETVEPPAAGVDVRASARPLTPQSDGGRRIGRDRVVYEALWTVGACAGVSSWLYLAVEHWL